MIIGTGVDIVDISRMNEKISKKILSDKELLIYNSFSSEKRKNEYLAGRFAIKECLVKALGRSLNFNMISIINDENGKPILTEKTIKYINEKFGRFRIHLTISHEKNYAIGFVIIESEG